MPFSFLHNETEMCHNLALHKECNWTQRMALCVNIVQVVRSNTTWLV